MKTQQFPNGTSHVKLTTKAKDHFNTTTSIGFQDWRDQDWPQFVSDQFDFRLAVSKEIDLPFEQGSPMYNRLWEVAEDFAADANTCTRDQQEDCQAGYVAHMWINLMSPLWDHVPRTSNTKDLTQTMSVRASDHFVSSDGFCGGDQIYQYQKERNSFTAAVAEAYGITLDQESEEWKTLWADASHVSSPYQNAGTQAGINRQHEFVATQVVLAWQKHLRIKS